MLLGITSFIFTAACVVFSFCDRFANPLNATRSKRLEYEVPWNRAFCRVATNNFAILEAARSYFGVSLVRRPHARWVTP